MEQCIANVDQLSNSHNTRELDKEQEMQLVKLEDALSNLPENLITFSESIRRLYTDCQVSSLDSSTSEFIELRDKTRRQAIIFANEVIPKSEEMIKVIKSYLILYTLGYKAWYDCLNKILINFKDAEGLYEFLRKSYGNIMEEMKTSGQEAKVAIENLEKVQVGSSMREKQEMARNEQCDMKPEPKKFKFSYDWKACGKSCISGIAAATSSYISSFWPYDTSAQIAQRLTDEQNELIVERAANLTVKKIMPAIKEFAESFQICLEFVRLSKLQIEKLVVDTDTERREKYYWVTNRKAREIGQLCEHFLLVNYQMSVNLTAIPEEPSDKNWVEQWREEVIRKP